MTRDNAAPAAAAPFASRPDAAPFASRPDAGPSACPPDAAPPDAAAAAGPSLAAFLRGGGPESRLRDLLAFGLAAEAGRPPGAGGVKALQDKAEAELAAHAVRLVHNQIETIRLQAVRDHISRMPRGLSFPRLVMANLVAFAILVMLALAATAIDPGWADRIGEMSAPRLAQ